MVLIMARMIGYVLTYGAFGRDPPTPFGVRGLNMVAGRGRWFYNLHYDGDCWVCDNVWRFREGPPNALRG